VPAVLPRRGGAPIHPLFAILLMLPLPCSLAQGQAGPDRPRARDAGVVIGILPPGPLNAITDVAGVRVGQATVTEGDSVRTGVTAILPHAGNVYRRRVPAAIHVGNGFGKIVGATQVRELGEIETPILLTCTLCVWKAADALVEWMLAQTDMAEVRSINPVVGETNDGYLNDIRSRPRRAPLVLAALRPPAAGPVEEGSVGAGTGTVAFGWKAGIGTSSRRLALGLGGYTVGVLVQTNFSGVLAINGAPVGRELGRYAFREELEGPAGRPRGEVPEPRPGEATPDGDAAAPGGSIMIVVATDAPLEARNLERLAVRALVGLARTGAAMSDGSGDYVIAFSTATLPERAQGDRSPFASETLPNEAMSPLFQAVAEATEEAIVNSLFRATTVRSRGGTVEALPIDRTLEILGRHGALDWDRRLPPARGGEVAR
jgi:D-aminopeptidase